jgi:hypothetical protein
MNKYLCTASLSIFINFCAVTMEPAEEPEDKIESKSKRNTDTPIEHKLQFIEALQNADIAGIKAILTKDRQHYNSRLLKNYLPAQLAYSAYRNHSLDDITKARQYLPQGVSPQKFDTILLELAKTNTKDPWNKLFMTVKIRFDEALVEDDSDAIIDILSENRRLLQSYLPAQLAYAVYKEHVHGVAYSQDDLPVNVSPKQFNLILFDLAMQGNNKRFLRLDARVPDTISNLHEFPTDPSGHYISLPPSFDLYPDPGSGSASSESSSEESSSDDDTK